MDGDWDMTLRSGDLDAVTDSGPRVSRKDSATARLTEEDWTKILLAASKKNVKVKWIADKYGIPRSTLRDRMKSGDTRPTTAVLGRPTFFTAEQEEKLETYLLYMADAGYALTHSQKLLNTMCVEAGLDDFIVGPKLIRGFLPSSMERHPDTRKRLEDHVKATRFDMSAVGLTDNSVVKRAQDRRDAEDFKEFMKEVHKDEVRRNKAAAAATTLAKKAAKAKPVDKPIPASSVGSKRIRAALPQIIPSNAVQRAGKRRCVPKTYGDFEQ